MKIILFANTDWYLFNFRRSLISALRKQGHDVLLVSPPGPYGKRLEELGFRWQPAPMERRSLNPLRELLLVLWLRSLFGHEGPDIVHGFTIKCAVYGSLAARLAGVHARVNAVAGMGYVFTSKDLKARLLRPVVSALMRFALDGHTARLILQNPDDVRLFAASRLVDPKRVRLIPGSGVDCIRFAPADGPDGSTPRKFRVLLPARLLWDKGLAEYVEAARQLLRQRRQIQFLIAGEPDAGNPAAAPTSVLSEWVREGIVEWLGQVEDMPGLYRSVDCVVLPSYREGLPKGLIEAAACGLPLVTTDVPGCREVVTHCVDGLLVPARDAASLADAIARLHDSASLRAKYGAAARAKALAQFDEQIVIASTIAVYDELVNAAP
ncbi:glycosyltransferase family 4 protein [Ramlibacter sp. AN1133]|uniref:glycosyltransferase family 4 protein n=1 Tax=Ramlibacter sp. AN1133 TaxID=3133429 RepID=UPI0030BF79E7